MAIRIGTALGAYEITAQLGAGGMGEVFRARDLKLKRDVAIKVLPDRFVADAERTVRFQREAETLAQLNHPNVAAIYDFQYVNGTQFLVLELVEGETLFDRIARGAIPIEESLKLAAQIAEGIQAAHDKGFLHRDLKPANIKIAGDGRVKVLDFGLAKIFEHGPADAAPTDSTTIAGTTHGTILGTAAYMSPEQARGLAVDRTTDVWAFGCVFYEMLTGRQAFTGKTSTDVLSAILTAEPNWTLLPKQTPSFIRLLKRCLQKDPRRRLHDIADARIEIEEGGDEPEIPATSPSRIPWVVATAAIAAAVLFGLLHLFGGASMDVRPEYVEISTPQTNSPSSFSVSRTATR